MTICRDKVKRLRDTIKYPWFVGFTFYCILYLNWLKRELSLWRLELSQNRIPLIDLLVAYNYIQLIQKMHLKKDLLESEVAFYSRI
jgi:hypothetical protein